MATTPKIILASTQDLKLEYQRNHSRWDQARGTVLQQLGELLAQHKIVLGVPLESRVKTWESIEGKLERRSLVIAELGEVRDIVGVRAILLFRSDVSRAHELVQDTFDVMESENTGDRLNENQFGYQSQHYLVQLPRAWLAIPSLQGLGDIRIEIQIRTLAQHVWASASHKLQYKNENSVPSPLLRTINRVAALLETVDLEFDRVLEERTTYEASIRLDAGTDPLNVDNLTALLDSILPPIHKNKAGEEYEDLLSDLHALSIKTVAELKDVWAKNSKRVLKQDKADVASKVKSQNFVGTSAERIDSGVFRTHTGLIRKALRYEYGDETVNEIVRRQRGRE